MPNITSNQIFSQSATEYKQSWLFALIWNAITWFAIVKGGNNILAAFDANPVFYFFISFPFIGLWILVLAIRQTLARYKFGKTPITLDPNPGQIGGRCAGRLDIPVHAQDSQQAIVSLSCNQHRLQSRGNGKQNWQVEPLWQDRIRLKPEHYGQKVRVNFSFDTPADLPASETKSDHYHNWSLQVRLPLSGIDYDRTFTMPMQTVESQQLRSINRFKVRPSTHTVSPAIAMDAIPEISYAASGTRFYYGYGRSKGTAIAVMTFGIALGVVGYFFFADFMSFFPATTSLMAAYVGFIAVGLLMLGLLLIINSLTVEVNVMGIRKQQRFLGFKLEEITEADDIVDIITEKNASSTSGNKTRVWFCLKLITTDGQTIELGDSLEGHSYAHEIRQKMLHALGSSWQPAKPFNQTEKRKRPIPLWLRRVGKILSYAFPIAITYDLIQQFPQTIDFIRQLMP